MTKRINIVSVLAIALLLGASTMAFAREAEPNDDKKGNNGNQIQSVLKSDNSVIKQDGAARLTVDPNGKFSASGLVVNSNSTTVTGGVAAGTINVKFFGFNFNMRVINAGIEGGSATSTVTEIAVGDKLLVTGSIDQTTGVITAERIVDQTLATRRTGDIQARITELLRIVDQLREQLRQMGR